MQYMSIVKNCYLKCESILHQDLINTNQIILGI